MATHVSPGVKPPIGRILGWLEEAAVQRASVLESVDAPRLASPGVRQTTSAGPAGAGRNCAAARLLACTPPPFVSRGLARALRSVRRGLGVDHVSAAAACAGRAVPGGPRSLRDLPLAGCRTARWRRAPPVRRAGVSRLSPVRLAGRWLRAVSLYGCGLDRLVPFSCRGRGFCPSCGGRRMAERAAHLVDRVFPAVPVRQWVLSFPHCLRYRLAWDHDLCRRLRPC